MQIRRQSTYKRTAASSDDKKNPASIEIHIPANDERQMQQHKIQSDDKTRHRVTLHHLANKYVL